MKQIIPFKKELMFNTKVSEITSISLEHNLELNDDLVSGEFIITGDYKMTDASINREKFDFRLPFDIAIDSRYNPDSLIIDIDNFYYEVVNNEFMVVNIDVFLEGEKIEEVEDVESEDDRSDAPIITLIPPKEEVLIKPIELPRNEEIDVSVDYKRPEVIKMEVNNNDFDIFGNVDNSDTYVTYHVYVVKESDTIDTIMDKYNVGKDSLAIYNDLENIKTGTKLIIPYESRN